METYKTIRVALHSTPKANNFASKIPVVASVQTLSLLLGSADHNSWLPPIQQTV